MTPVSDLPNYKKSRCQSSTISKTEKNKIKFNETELGYHYELKIPGYIKEDFRLNDKFVNKVGKNIDR